MTSEIIFDGEEVLSENMLRWQCEISMTILAVMSKVMAVPFVLVEFRAYTSRPVG